MTLHIPSKTLICVLRASPAFYRAVEQAVQDQGDPTVRIWQGQAKTYNDGTINPSLFVQQDFDDHPGKPLSTEERAEIQKRLRDPSYTLRIVNSVAGENASDRALAGIYALMHADMEYRARNGVSVISYDLLYDGDGRNDKIHVVEHPLGDGTSELISEDNAPSGVYGPHVYHRVGADAISVFDPHSKIHISNLSAAFARANVGILTNLESIADDITNNHRAALLDGRFRIGAPDGWDKKDNPEKNAAIVRVNEVAAMILERIPELKQKYANAANFLATSQFGIIKVREAAYPGAPAKPVVKQLIGDVRGCDCYLIDDLADSGGSLLQSGEALLKGGAENVDAAVCHGPAAQESLHRILRTMREGTNTPVIRHLTITNTMARVEGFHAALPPEEQQRTTLINCAGAYLEHVAQNDLHRQPGLDLGVFGASLTRILGR